ncbi:Methyltransferase [Apiospora aurea]|uniref:Methyltransferase n=1 Tax=Apiospora aurea TaxID=335848 RepID=A0ABR1QND1_9PEZI
MLASLQEESKPWMARGNNRTRDRVREAMDDTSKVVEWYQPTVKSLPASTVEFFENYVGVKGEDVIKEHIYTIRDMAWKVLPYPCIGLFRFLDFSIHLSPDYPRVVKRVQEGATLLDLGCCFGQDLRKLAYDAGPGAPTRNLIGTDLEPAFLQLGYELFADRDRFEATFVPADVFAEDFLAEYRGKVDIVYLGSFLHLFSEPQQRVVVRQLRRLLRPRAGSMVFGRNLGAGKGGPFRMESIGWDLYRHDPNTIADLFQSSYDEAETIDPYANGGGEAKAQWEVTSSLGRYGSANWDDDRRGWQGDETKQMMFTAIRL